VVVVLLEFLAGYRNFLMFYLLINNHDELIRSCICHSVGFNHLFVVWSLICIILWLMLLLFVSEFRDYSVAYLVIYKCVKMEVNQ
jgi:hypothetical protein